MHLPKNEVVQESHTGVIPWNDALSHEASIAHVFPCITNSSLIYIGKLCDDGCKELIEKNNLNIYKNGNVVLKGTLNLSDGLWDVIIPGQRKEYENAIIRRDKKNMSLRNIYTKVFYHSTQHITKSNKQ